MINTGLHPDLHNFFADLWNAAEQTCGNSRFLRPLSCWLTSCAYKELPKYMKDEYDRGRVITYPLFPKCVYNDMGYDRKLTLSQIKDKAITKKEKHRFRTWIRSLTTKR